MKLRTYYAEGKILSHDLKPVQDHIGEYPEVVPESRMARWLPIWARPKPEVKKIIASQEEPINPQGWSRSEQDIVDPAKPTTIKTSVSALEGYVQCHQCYGWGPAEQIPLRFNRTTRICAGCFRSMQGPFRVTAHAGAKQPIYQRQGRDLVKIPRKSRPDNHLGATSADCA